jgi:hypothetical protein
LKIRPCLASDLPCQNSELLFFEEQVKSSKCNIK